MLLLFETPTSPDHSLAHRENKTRYFTAAVQQTCSKLLRLYNKCIRGDRESLGSHKKVGRAARDRHTSKILNTDEKLNSSCRSSRVWLVNSNTPSSPTVGSHQYNGNKHQTSAFLNTAHTHRSSLNFKSLNTEGVFSS